MNVSEQFLKDLVKPNGKSSIIKGIAKYLTEYSEEYGITTDLRLAHFIAQAAHETAHFNTLVEYWGPTSYQKRYEGRKDLGNVIKGDGSRFRGRGMFQYTGRANYTELSQSLQVNFVDNPKLLQDPKYAVLSALEYWKTRNLSDLADLDNCKGITKIINGGYNGLQEREEYLEKAKKLLKEINNKKETEDDAPTKKVEEASDDISWKDFSISEIQTALVITGYRITVDNDFGPRTKAALKNYQRVRGLEPDGLWGPKTCKVMFGV